MLRRQIDQTYNRIPLAGADIMGKQALDLCMDFAHLEISAYCATSGALALAVDLYALGPLPHIDPVDEPLFRYQWHLLNVGQTGGPTGIDINVVGAWVDYSGAGVAIGIWDDGVEYDHPDLAPNYDPALHVPLEDGTVHDPYPENLNSRHGTAVAGVIAAAANREGVVGVAHGARIAGVDIFEDPALWDDVQTDELWRFDVTNHSWGWTVEYYDSVLDPDPFFTAFHAGLRESVELGRDGLGTINVTSAGNARLLGRHANDSNFTNMPETIAVAAVSDDGHVAYYSTPGASLLVSAPSGERTWRGDAGIWTTDRMGDAGYSDGASQRPENSNPDYGSRFNGTSAAAPIVTGVVALVLEANPELGWRDVQEILALSARHVGTPVGDGALSEDERHAWGFNAASHWNGGGMHFSNDYGFGLVDALAAVRLAETWTTQQTSANWRIETGATWEGDALIPDNTPGGLTITFSVDSDIDLEMVSLRLDMRLDEFASDSLLTDLTITLTSPDGTTSILATPMARQFLTPDKWVFTSNAFRGENAAGDWTLNVADALQRYENTLSFAQLDLLGDDFSVDDTYFFTDEFSDYAGGAFGHAAAVADRNGGVDTINAAAVGTDTTINLAKGIGLIDGVTVRGLKNIENAFTGDGDDILIGDGGRNDLRGGRGDDVIGGGNGADVLSGGEGADTLRGGRGADILFDGAGVDDMWGGAGPDTFVLTLDWDDDFIHDFRFGLDQMTFLGVTAEQISVADNGRNSVKIDAAGDFLFLHGGGPRLLTAAILDVEDFLFA